MLILVKLYRHMQIVTKVTFIKLIGNFLFVHLDLSKVWIRLNMLQPNGLRKYFEKKRIIRFFLVI